MRKYLSQMLSENKMTLIMSMPVNDPDVMRAALDAGADVVKVHVNLLHRASGNSFGTLEENREVLGKMLAMTDAPMGVVLGADVEIVRRECKVLQDFDFSFLSLYGHHAPSCVLDIPQELMAACDGTYPMEEVRAFEKMDAKVLEASIMPGSEYGQPLQFRDLCKYRALAENTRLPVVVPTQRRVLPEDVPALYETGVKGLMVGAVVTGETAQSVYASVREFRKAIDRL
ncbi:MAG: hypothetical protein IKT57_09900 [Clostridia bacterium]|nr:hypothetical protein [Clostridia bacterium]